MSHPEFLIAIEPPKEIKENIVPLREYIVKKTGKDIYGTHDPHITLFSNHFRNFSDLNRELKDLSEKEKPFMAKIHGLHVFEGDKLHDGANTVVYRIEENPYLRKLQSDIINRVNPLRTDDYEKGFLRQSNNWSKPQLANIKKYGFPYGPKDYIYHSSIGTIPASLYPKMEEYIRKFDSKQSWQVNSIDLLRKLGSDGFKFYKRYELKG